jgi:polar amino acid transport system permease protein/octopine/nopaline transport system permease protein
MLDFALMWTSLPELLQGLWLTVRLTLAILALGLIVAFPVALARISAARWLSALANVYILIFRGTPALVQLALLYYGAGQFESVRASPAWVLLREPFWCAVIALGLNSGAYTGQNLSGALRAVPTGMLEASRALGLSSMAAFLTVRLPLALRIAWPAYGNEVILTLKATSLASAITLLELTGRARSIVANTYAPYEIFLLTGLVYLAMTYALSRLFTRVEQHLRMP